VRLFVLTRHGRSTMNDEGRVNGDPGVPVPLTEAGRAGAAQLGRQLAELPIDLCVHTRFPRTRETADLILVGRDVPRFELPLLDDIDVGEFEGETVAAYETWKRAHERADAFPGGESLDDAARCYALGFRELLDRAERTILVCHEIPVRYALNAAGGSTSWSNPTTLSRTRRPTCSTRSPSRARRSASSNSPREQNHPKGRRAQPGGGELRHPRR
jgi:probable phosphoglycerate mutase